MIIEVEVYEQIRYLHSQLNTPQREIARTLGISRTTVKKYLDGATVPWERCGISGRTPYVITEDVMTFIQACLLEDETEKIKKQQHTARRIHQRLVDEKGFTGGESTLRPIVAQLKEKMPKSFVPLSYEPGEAIQIDWGEATVYLNGKKMKVYLFCLRQCFSADIFVSAFYRQNEESFLEGLSAGLKFFGGAPTRVIFDNAKVAVKEGFGVHAKVQDRYKAFAAHHAFKTEFCNVAAGHEKGLVEGLVGYIRRNVLVPVPRLGTIDELNSDLHTKCLKYRNHTIKGRTLSVGKMVEIDTAKLTALPQYVFDTSRTLIATVDEFSTFRFDTNTYSVPFSYVGKDISVKGYGNVVKAMYKNVVIAIHSRSYGRSEVKYEIEHYIGLIEQRPRSAYNAKPVKANLHPELMALGQRLSNPKEMVKLLKLCIEHGQESVLNASREIGFTESASVALLTVYLRPCSSIKPLLIPNEIKVRKTNLQKYDGLLRGEVAI